MSELRITARQQQALDFIARYLRANKRAPSYREIARELGVSSLNTVQGYLRALEGRGLIAIERDGQEEAHPSWRRLEIKIASS